MTFSITYGAALAAPTDESGIRIEREFVGSKSRMIDGTQRADIVTEKAIITVEWVGLNKDEKATLRTNYTTYRATATNLVITNGTTSQTFSVLAIDGWSEQVWYDRSSNDYYDVTIRFSEV